ncbi:MAG: hypothetical protein LBR83_10730 [Clostridiales bacterium]|jgi:hypothetical protein|nr:hypothetical protein [Clostridiales bacterium]
MGEDFKKICALLLICTLCALFAKPVTAASAADVSAWWDGQWYGWYNFPEAEGYHADEQGITRDCAVFLDMNGETGTLYIWDDYNDLGYAEVVLDTEDGAGPLGRLVAADGTLFGYEVAEEAWYIDPVESGFEDTFYLTAFAENPYNAADYVFFELVLRPWGVLWDDVREDNKPVSYEWYKERIEIRDSMLEALSEAAMGGDNHPVFVPDALPRRAYEPNAHTHVAAGLTGEINIEDKFFMRYPHNAFTVSEEFENALDANNGTVRITYYPQNEDDYHAGLTFSLDYHKGAPEYSTAELNVAGFDAVRVSYRDPDYDSYYESIYFIHFGGEGYYGAIVTCSSEFDLESTHSPEVQSVLDSIRVAP